MHALIKDLTGKTFGRLTAIRFVQVVGGHAQWEFRCICGGTIITQGSRVVIGTTMSCGCRAMEGNPVHGHTPKGQATPPEYKSWCAAKARCFNKTNKKYPRYGGRGITMCDRWRDSFQAFLDDMGTRPLGKTLDRFPDNNGNYEPGNCRWATPKEQANNRRSSRRFAFEGRSGTMAEWSKELGISLDTLSHRLRGDYTIREAFTKPLLQHTDTFRRANASPSS